MRYPKAEWVPWLYTSTNPTYYHGTNKPIAAVLHVMQGYGTTARQWAGEGFFGKSWHFTITRTGTIMQHLEFTDGGYHAGIPDSAPHPTWPLWKGPGINVNDYTIGIEHEGFSGEPFTEAQAEASRELCQWLSEVLDFPYDELHFPAHAEIDVVNRVNDFNVPELRQAHYQFMFQEDDMTEAQVQSIIKAMLDEGKLASTTDVLACVAQIVGAEENTYSDKDRIEKVRAAIAGLATPALSSVRSTITKAK